MPTTTATLNSPRYDLSSDTTWRELYPWLRCLARKFVYSLHVPYWNGQEEDLIEDVVQETAQRIIERSQQAEHGEANPIRSLDYMIIAIVRNYCVDLNRRDRRLVRTPSEDRPPEVWEVMDDQDTPSEMATENAYQEELFRQLALEIAKFPEKQRTALLIDLANLMHFEERPTPLQKAFLAVGIQLQDYQQPLPDNPTARSRHIANLCIAYKRVTNLSNLSEFRV